MIKTSENKMQFPKRENCAFVHKQNQGRGERPNDWVIVVFYIWKNKKKKPLKYMCFILVAQLVSTLFLSSSPPRLIGLMCEVKKKKRLTSKKYIVVIYRKT